MKHIDDVKRAEKSHGSKIIHGMFGATVKKSVFQLAVLYYSLRCGAYGTFCYGIS